MSLILPEDEQASINAKTGRSQSDALTSSVSVSYRALKQLSVALSLATSTSRPLGAQGDGNISYPEFVDGLARDLVASSSIWGSVTQMKSRGSPRASSPVRPSTPRTPRGVPRSPRAEARARNAPLPPLVQQSRERHELLMRSWWALQ